MKFRFEIITTCCAALLGTLFLAAVWWFSGLREWVGEASLIGSLACGWTACLVHALVHELNKMAEERQKKRR